MVKTVLARRLVWVITTLSSALVALGLALSLLALVRSDGKDWLPTHLLFTPVLTLAFSFAGALIVSRHPRHPIAWILNLSGGLSGVTFLAFAYWLLGTAGGGALPGVAIAFWLDLWIWIPATILPTTFLLLLFPAGRLPSARWRPVAGCAGLGLAAGTLGIALHPRPPIAPIPPVNPFGIPGGAAAMDLLLSGAFVLLAVGTLGALAALVVRFRRARGIERAQLQWLAYASGLGGLIITLSSVLSAVWPTEPALAELGIISSQVALSLIAIAVGIAILRYRLYDIDLLINRTLVYGTLSAAVVGLYVLLVGTLGALFQSSGNVVLAVLATGLVALVAQPLRTRLQRSVNRLMYGARDDPYTVLSHLSQQLKTTLAPPAVLPRIVVAVAQTLKLPYVALALQHEGGLEIAAAYGRPAGDPLRLPLVYQAETIGHLLVAPRAPGETFTAAERRLLEDIALQAGIAAHALRLTADLQRSRERLVTAREEERRRLRRDLHDGLGPQLASLTLTVAAARELIRLDVEAADGLLRELAFHTQAAVADLRRVVYDLRPPALDDLGLVLAVREQAARYRQAGLQITIHAPDQVPPLPAAVEVAAYRIVQEALTNVVRHAAARACTVTLTLTPDDTFAVMIRDDGVGLPGSGRVGVGLTSMRERAAELGGTCLIESGPGRGTCIEARLPLPRDPACAGEPEDVWSTSAS
jgi:signal transduction histidine kinase